MTEEEQKRHQVQPHLRLLPGEVCAAFVVPSTLLPHISVFAVHFVTYVWPQVQTAPMSHCLVLVLATCLQRPFKAGLQHAVSSCPTSNSHLAGSHVLSSLETFALSRIIARLAIFSFLTPSFLFCHCLFSFLFSIIVWFNFLLLHSTHLCFQIVILIFVAGQVRCGPPCRSCVLFDLLLFIFLFVPHRFSDLSCFSSCSSSVVGISFPLSSLNCCLSSVFSSSLFLYFCFRLGLFSFLLALVFVFSVLGLQVVFFALFRLWSLDFLSFGVTKLDVRCFF